MAYTFKHGDRPIDGYTIQRAVGKGGFGEVYYAISDGGREVALKYLRDNPQVELRGVSHCINLKSPHLVSIFDVKKTTDGEYVIIMEYCSGPSLRDVLMAEPNGFAPQKAAFFVREIAKGLAYLHDRGIVHRDLKPGNLFYDDGYVKIGDYGLSKFISISRHSGQTASVGTVHYMAPEIGSGNYSRGVDIYALGVILYEMLLGKVPFEGSTMAEVLMKHLTAQPEIETLPQPFGHVIRKALQKDPNDRYQTVDEMVEELLAVDEIRESVAGFRPQSLDAAVHGGGRHDSPMPSPNPMLRDAQQAAQAAAAGWQPPYAQPINRDAPLPAKLAKRMDRVSRRMSEKMAKLAAKHPGRAPLTPPPPPTPQAAAAGGPALAPLAPADRKKRILLTGLLSIGLAVGLGVLIGSTGGDVAGTSAGMLAVAMSGGVLLSRRAVGWFGIEHGPKWSRRLVQLCCCAPLLAIGAAPLLDVRGEEGAAVYLGLLICAVFFDAGEKGGRHGADPRGEISFGAAIWAAFVGAFFTGVAGAIVGEDPDEVIWIAAGVTGVASLILQATSWWSIAAPAAPAKSKLAAVDAQPHDVQPPPGAQPFHPDPPHPATAPAPMGPVPTLTASHLQDQVERWGITRAVWGLIAFALMSGTIVTFLIPLVATDFDHHDVTGSIIICTACFSFVIFALRKTTPLKRDGFWRETIRPFLIATSMAGIGAAITGIAREWGHRSYCSWKEGSFPCLADEGRVGLITGLVMCSLAFLILILFTGRKKRLPPQPFLQNYDSPARADLHAAMEQNREDGCC